LKSPGNRISGRFFMNDGAIAAATLGCGVLRFSRVGDQIA
jgi:hypothetical protein